MMFICSDNFQGIYIQIFQQSFKELNKQGTMYLKQNHCVVPGKHSYTINTKQNSLAIHPSSDYMAYITRTEELVVYNRKTGRSAVALKSKHGISFIMYTLHHLIVIERGFPQILVFSIKTEKLKKKLTGHRTQVQRLAYCPQRGVFCSISHDLCLIWDQSTLNVQKKLKCSTSQYCDCLFTPNGKYLFTAFSDGNVFKWDLDSYQHTQAALKIRPHHLACTYSNFIVAYESKQILIADFTSEGLYFEPIEQFWNGEVEKTDFSNHNLLIKTTEGFYIAEVYQEYKFLVKNAKKLVQKISNFFVGGYGEEIITINKQLTKIKIMNIFNSPSSTQIPLTNPLINPGNQCAGGFQNKYGCTAQSGNYLNTYPYQDQQYKVEPMNNGLYEAGEFLSSEKLQVYIRKNFFFPDKYRPLAYKSLLNIPINKNMFRDLESKGRHPCVKMLESKYPLKNMNLSQAFKDIISLLGNYCPVFAESEDVPGICFPFVCLLGNDKFFCFQVLYRLFINWLSFIFTEFPLANSELLQNMFEIIEAENPSILNHLKSRKISKTKLVWHFLSTIFTTNVKREVFLAIIDTLFAHPSEPQLFVFMVIAYISYNQTRILSMDSEDGLNRFLDSEHTVNTSVFIKKAYQIRQKYQKKLRYPFQVVDYQYRKYISFDGYPKHAVKMFEGKRKLEQEQFDRAMDNKKYHEEMAKQMDKMIVKAKRDTQKNIIQSQSLALYNENQCKNKLNMPKINQKARRERLQQLISEIKEMVEQSEDKKSKMKQLAPVLNQVYQEQNDEELEILQNKLMNLLTRYEPHRFHQPIKSVPVVLGKTKVEDYKQMKAAKNSQVANKLWQNDKIQHKIQQRNWEQDFMSSLSK